MYINTTVRARRLQVNGTYKVVSEKYLINATSFAEAEEKAYREFDGTSALQGVKAVSASKIAHVKRSDIEGAKFYEGRIDLISYSKKMVKSRSPHLILVQAESLLEAVKEINEYAKDFLTEVEVMGAKHAGIIDVI